MNVKTLVNLLYAAQLILTTLRLVDTDISSALKINYLTTQINVET